MMNKLSIMVSGSPPQEQVSHSPKRGSLWHGDRDTLQFQNSLEGRRGPVTEFGTLYIEWEKGWALHDAPRLLPRPELAKLTVL